MRDGGFLHALDLHRAAGIEFDCAVFTNLTQDHLDYHGTLDDYFAAKRRLFVPEAGVAPAAAVINSDDEWGARLADEVTAAGHTPVMTFGLEPHSGFRATNVRYDAAGSTFECHSRGASVDVRVPLPGLFNVYNALGAIAASHALGVSPHGAAEALATAQRVPGRFEPVDEGQDFAVARGLRAHPGLPRERAGLRARPARPVRRGGSPDRRVRRGRRPRPRQAAADGRGRATPRRPRRRDVRQPALGGPRRIIAAIVAGAEAAEPWAEGSSLEVEPDRRRAIERAMEVARAGDIVLIAGKGHEQGQEFAEGRKVPFDDRDVARDALRGLGARR